LGVYADTASNHPWFVCDACEFAGSAFDLVSRMDSVSLTEAAAILRCSSEAGADTVSPAWSHAVSLAHQYGRIATAWNSAAQLTGQQVAAAVSPLVGRELGSSWDALRLHDLLRYVKPQDCPAAVQRALWRERGRGRVRIPRIVAPLEDLPGRICALLEWRDDAAMPMLGHVTRATVVFGLRAAHADNAPERLLLLPTARRAVRQQLLDRAAYAGPSCALGAVFGRESNGYLRELAPRLVLVVPADKRPTPRMLREAAAADMRIFRGVLRGSTSRAWAAQAHKSSRGWLSVLAATLVDQPVSTAAAYLREMCLPGAQLQQALDTLPKLRRRQVAAALGQLDDTVAFGPWIIRARGGYLYADGSSAPLSDAVVRITDATETPRGEMLRGRVDWAGRVSAAFSVPATTLYDDAYKWLVRFSGMRRMPVPYVAPDLRPHILALGMTLGRVQYQARTPPVGYDEKTQQLVLARYSIGHDGTIAPCTRPGVAPGNLPRPLQLTQALVQQVSAAPEWSMVFNAICYISATVLRRFFGETAPQYPLLVLGPAATRLARAAPVAFGCLPDGRTTPDAVVAATAAHDWPRVATYGATDTAPALARAQACFVAFRYELSAIHAIVHAPVEAALVTRAASNTGARGLDSRFTDVLAAFLYYVMQCSRPQLAAARGTVSCVAYVRRLLAAWWREHGGRVPNLGLCDDAGALEYALGRILRGCHYRTGDPVNSHELAARAARVFGRHFDATAVFERARAAGLAVGVYDSWHLCNRGVGNG